MRKLFFYRPEKWWEWVVLVFSAVAIVFVFLIIIAYTFNLIGL